MESPHKPKHLSSTFFFLFIFISSNLVTLFISTSLFNPCALTTTRTDNNAITTMVEKKLFDEEITRNNDGGEGEQDLPDEFMTLTSPQKLPFGVNPNSKSDKIISPVGKPCTLFPNELKRFMSYTVNGSCPDDELLAQRLLLKGCEPLPRRRCRVAAPETYVEHHPFPECQWSTPSDSSIVWTAYTCKNYSCLINRRKNQKEFDDCKDCFDLQGREKNRWAETIGGGLDFSIDEVLGVKKQGTIKIGLDIGGGVATFAVRMRERNITIITTSMNLNGPFNNFIAARGVVPLYLSISQRLPFFDNTLDIVHSMHVLSNWIPTTMLHFLLFDIYRVLRPGGLFWLDHFFCIGEQYEEVYKPLIQSIGFNQIKWVTGRKLDRGPDLNEMYLSALLEKPLSHSW
ncbi:methyltransferase [Lithospermum erythrorhizon]|uniref:Methyltransferase n=1 Tax=Lithospermum erythrorhizon TaxID=34254 RepID=A0AAV3RPV2_LITER